MAAVVSSICKLQWYLFQKQLSVRLIKLFDSIGR
jgi:hypothetical protein